MKLLNLKWDRNQVIALIERRSRFGNGGHTLALSEAPKDGLGRVLLVPYGDAEETGGNAPTTPGSLAAIAYRLAMACSRDLPCWCGGVIRDHEVEPFHALGMKAINLPNRYALVWGGAPTGSWSSLTGWPVVYGDDGFRILCLSAGSPLEVKCQAFSERTQRAQCDPEHALSDFQQLISHYLLDRRDHIRDAIVDGSLILIPEGAAGIYLGIHCESERLDEVVRALEAIFKPYDEELVLVEHSGDELIEIEHSLVSTTAYGGTK